MSRETKTVRSVRTKKSVKPRAFHENLLRSFEPGRRVWPWLGVEKIRRNHVKTKLLCSVKDRPLLARWNDFALLPALNGGGIVVTQSTAERSKPTKFGNDAVDSVHNRTIRIMRTSVNSVGRRKRTGLSAMLKPMDTTISASNKISEIRERTGLSMKDFARELGYKDASGVQRYFKEDEFGDKPFPMHFVQKLVEHLPGRGEPAIQVQELIELAGPVASQVAGGPVVSIMERLLSEMTQMRQQQAEMMAIMAHILNEMHRRQSE